MMNGGNQWSGWVAFLSFFRHVVKFQIDYSRWQHYETAAELGGPRVMHPEFCLISERPVRLLVDAQSRPHCGDGPFCAWRDGTALYAWHGTRVPKRVIVAPETLTAADILGERNAEVRRVMIERVGHEKFLQLTGAHPIQADATGTLYRIELPGDEPIVLVGVVNSTPEPDGSYKRYVLRVPPQMTRAREAVAWTFGMSEQDYAPRVES